MQNRREFLVATAGGLGAGALAGCLPHAPPPPGVLPLTAADFHRRRHLVSLPEGRIAVVERGRGPAALFVHGYPLNGFQWRGAVDRLQAHRRCITPDLMGLGYSEVPESQALHLDAQAGMLAHLLDALHVDRVDVIGNDSGGATAQLFATRCPHRVRTLLLTNCDTPDDSPPPSFLPIIDLARQGRLAGAIARQRENPELARGRYGLGQSFMDPTRLTDEVIDTYLAPLVATPARRTQVEAFALALAHNPLEGIEPRLRALRVPVSIVWGDADTVFSPNAPAWLARTLPMVRAVRHVPGARLFFPEEFPDVIAGEALRLWGVRGA